MLFTLAADQLLRLPRDIADQHRLAPLGAEHRCTRCSSRRYSTSIAYHVSTEKPALSPPAKAGGLAAGYHWSTVETGHGPEAAGQAALNPVGVEDVGAAGRAEAAVADTVGGKAGRLEPLADGRRQVEKSPVFP